MRFGERGRHLDEHLPLRRFLGILVTSCRISRWDTIGRDHVPTPGTTTWSQLLYLQRLRRHLGVGEQGRGPPRCLGGKRRDTPGGHMEPRGLLHERRSFLGAFWFAQYQLLRTG